MNPRTNIGVFVDTLDHDYQQQIVLGIDAEARALDLDVTCFAGGVLEAPHPVHRAANIAYELCSSEQLDGLIVLSGTLSNYSGMEALGRHCQRFMSLPVCSIGGALAGAVEVAVDNRAGVRQALTFLAQTCGRRRIAFVKGPAGNDEAQERFQVYKEAVADLRLANEAELVVDGDFLEPSGARAVKTLLDDRRLGFDALMCASDLMAIGAMRALAERKVAVPQKVAVVGFDDIPAARFAAPSLATVRQPLYEQGRRALREVVARLSEKELPGRVFLDATFIPRESCGARALAAGGSGLPQLLADPELLEPLRFEEAYRLALPRILTDVRRVIEESGFDCEPGLPETLLVQAATDIQGRRRGLLQGQSFVSFLEDVVGQVDRHTSSADVSSWQEVIGVMRRHFSLCLRQDPKWRRSAEEMWHQARSTVSLLAERSQARRWLTELELFRTVRVAGTRLINTASLAELGEALAETLSELAIPGCFVALARDDGSHRGVLAVRGHGVSLEPEGELSKRLMPEAFASASPRATWLVEPLVLRQRRLGYIVFEAGPVEGRVYAALRDQLSAALGVPEPMSAWHTSGPPA